MDRVRFSISSWLLPVLIFGSCAVGSSADPVPAVAPDTLPSRPLWDSIYAAENMVYDGRVGWRVPRNILLVRFHAEATQEQRQEALDLIEGEVLGGLGGGPLGAYLVRISDDGTIEPLLRAIEDLQRLAQVRSAHPHPPPVTN
jgi:hypothetical protein